MKGGNEGRREGVEMEGEGRRGKEEEGERGRREEGGEEGWREEREGERVSIYISVSNLTI